MQSQIAYQQQASKFLEEPAFKHDAELIADRRTETGQVRGGEETSLVMATQFGPYDSLRFRDRIGNDTRQYGLYVT